MLLKTIPDVSAMIFSVSAIPYPESAINTAIAYVIYLLLSLGDASGSVLNADCRFLDAKLTINTIFSYCF